MAIFIDIWPCLFTTKLSYAQLCKWGNSKMSWYNIALTNSKAEVTLTRIVHWYSRTIVDTTFTQIRLTDNCRDIIIAGHAQHWKKRMWKREGITYREKKVRKHFKKLERLCFDSFKMTVFGQSQKNQNIIPLLKVS